MDDYEKNILGSYIRKKKKKRYIIQSGCQKLNNQCKLNKSQKQKISNVFFFSTLKLLSLYTDSRRAQYYNIMYNIFYSIVEYFPYKIRHSPQLSFDFFVVPLSVQPGFEPHDVLSFIVQLFFQSGDLFCRVLLQFANTRLQPAHVFHQL